MNLGQLIGELRLRAEGIEPRTEAPAPDPEPARRVWGKRQEQVIDLIRERGVALSAEDVSTALGITQNNAATLLNRMRTAGKLKRASDDFRATFLIAEATP